MAFVGHSYVPNQTSVKKYILLLLLANLYSCISPNTAERELYELMNGSFSSGPQSLEDSTYYDITLQMAHIWEGRNEYWIYAEQALTNASHRPYAQRIYQISSLEDGLITLQPFDFDHPERFFGKWKEPLAFDSLKPEDLTIKPDCRIIFRKEDDCFIGESEGLTCNLLSSSSSYSTTRLEVRKENIMNWTRGYNDQNMQVWGKSNGGYIFNRMQ